MRTSKAAAGREARFPGILAALVCIALYCLLVWLTVRPVGAWYEVGRGGEKGLAGAVRCDSGNAVYSYLLGRYYALNVDKPDPVKAVSYYRRAVALNPLQAQAWVGLSRSLLHMGKTSEADYALDRSVRLEPTDPDFMWEASNFWLMNGHVDRAVAALRKFILLAPENQLPVYDLCWKLQLGNDYIIRNLLPHQYDYERTYLNYLISADMPAEAEEIWKLIDKNSLDRRLFIRYINFLINCGLYDRAEKDWRDIETRSLGLKSGTSFPLIWNADFENEIMNGGFGWIVGNADGVEPFIDDSVHMNGNHSLGVTFTGKNPGVTIARQVVRVRPGARYSLRAYIRTEAITSSNGIFLAVTGLGCSGLNGKSDSLTGTNFWRRVRIDFEVPQSCFAAVIAIRRERSNKLDNKITGTAWIDSLSLREQPGTVTADSKRP